MVHQSHWHNGNRLVSVTELQSIIAKPYLDKWKQGLCDYTNGKCGFTAAKAVADTASTLGNEVHEQVEKWLKTGEEVEGTYEANMWSDKIIGLYTLHKVKPIVIAPEENLLDNESNLAGSPDHIIEYDGIQAIGDLKIKNSLDSLTAFQGCGYRYLLKRVKGVDINKMLVVHCKKKTVSKLVDPVWIDLDPWMKDWVSLVHIWNRINPSRKVLLSW